MKVLVTGSAGFIGAAVSKALLDRGDEVLGIDNMSPYYDVNLKRARLERIANHTCFQFNEEDLINDREIEKIFTDFRPERVINLAAQAGVRYSLENPSAYIDSNIVGFQHILDCCRRHDVEHLVYASSSSVYGANVVMPFSVHHSVNHPLSLYAATKKANELMAHCYSHLYRLPTTGLRFFTVYGPWGRPDMALFKFTRNILDGKPIQVFNEGRQSRDFTYIDDIVTGVLLALDTIAKPNADWSPESPDPATSDAPYRVYNIGNNRPVNLLYFIEVLEGCLKTEAKKELLPMQPGDVPRTFADVADLCKNLGYRPDTRVEDGVRQFVNWYRSYYGI